MSYNTAALLSEVVARNPDGRALIYPEGGVDRILSFAELESQIDSYSHGLRTFGVRPGDRVLLLESNGVRFIALTFALFKLGALPVLIDPGMGIEAMLNCVRQVQPDVLVGTQKAQFLRTMHSEAFSQVRRSVCTDGRWIGASPLWRIAQPESGKFTAVNCSKDQAAAILFTSGSTGPAKGVIYRHGIFYSQVSMLRDAYGFQPGQIDMPGFPLFALLSLAVGMTCYLPPINPSRPASVLPEQVLRPIQDWQISNLTGSPAIWDKVGRYCKRHAIKLPSVKRVLTFGAAISLELISIWHDILPPDGDIFTPYGATEALPIANIGGRQLLAECAAHTREGGGACVGKPFPEVEVRIIKISDEVIPEWREELLQGSGQVGEIAVCGDVVTWAYERQPEATKSSKIIQGDKVWHRMGDLGYLDSQGQLWIVGRKSHRIQGRSQLYFPVCAEGMVEEHPEVKRTALVGIGPANDQTPVLVVEPRQARVMRDIPDQQRISRELKALLATHPIYGEVKQVLFHPGFPVDKRHNAKIHREQLAPWAEAMVKP